MAFQTFTDEYLQKEWIQLNFQQTFNNRNCKLNIYSRTNFKIGKNIPTNRLNDITNKLDLSWLNLSQTLSKSSASLFSLKSTSCF